MKFLLFDEYAISTYVSENRLQSVEYPEEFSEGYAKRVYDKIIEVLKND